MNKRYRYIATGLVFGELWGGGNGYYPTIELEADTMIDLVGKATLHLYSGTLDSGMGFKELIGAVLDITRKTYLEIDDEIFVSEKYYFDSIGNLNIKQYELLQSELLFNNQRNYEDYNGR